MIQRKDGKLFIIIISDQNQNCLLVEPRSEKENKTKEETSGPVSSDHFD